MKNILFSLSLCLSLSLSAQNFTGNYTSNRTSFKDDLSPEKSFTEETLFNIIINFKNENEGAMAIQDPRIPDKILMYRTIKLIRHFKAKGNEFFIFQALTEHLNVPDTTEIIFYTDKGNNLNLMVNDPESSQVFHDLEKE